MDFFRTAVGIGAVMLGIAGSVGLLFGTCILAATVHWAFGFGVLLVPVWLAAGITIAEWAAEL